MVLFGFNDWYWKTSVTCHCEDEPEAISTDA